MGEGKKLPQKQGESREYTVGDRKPPEENRFAPGQSGNPGGRPKGAVSIVAIIRRMLDEERDDITTGEKKKLAEIIADRLITKALNENNLRALQDIIDRIDGKATLKSEISGPDGKPITINDARAELNRRLDGVASRVKKEGTT